MHILHVAAEFAPLAKVGGLADVVYGLAKEQALLGHQVEVVLPKYDIIPHQKLQDFSLSIRDLWSFEDSSRYHNSVYSGSIDNLHVHLIEPHHNHYYFHRGQIYGCHDDVDKFLYFCRTVGEYLYLHKQRPDIIHLHDWHTAPLAPILQHIYRDLGFSYGKIICTIHNIEHQGKCYPSNLNRIGLRGEDFRTAERLQDPQDPSLINLLKGGLVYADAVTTVSPTYAKEITTPHLGFGLDGVISHLANRFTGILNGIELDTWNPTQDQHIAVPYPTNATFIEMIAQKKASNKEALYRQLHLKPSKGPLLACISRLTPQKGPKLIAHAIRYALQHNASFILLGSSLDTTFENEFHELQNQYKDHPHFYMKLIFDEPLAHLLYAAADAIFIPSIFEPCGLTQMIAMHYGTLPIVRKTGGLADTVFDTDNSRIPLHSRNGFVFENPDSISIEKVLKRALSCFTQNRQRWHQLMQNSLRQDFGWKQSALLYDRLYTQPGPGSST